jgi:hypothetical protein
MGAMFFREENIVKHKYCPRYSVALKTTDATKDNPVLIYRARCKQWDCPYCSVINQRIWRGRIMLQVERQPTQAWYFWTVTLDGRDHIGDTANSLYIWREHWDKLLKRVKRDIGKFDYLRVFECHKDGTLHIHMLANASYPDVICVRENDGRENYRSESFQQHLTQVGLGWRHDIKPIKTPDSDNNGVARNVSAYVTKYLTKDLQSDVRQLLKSAGMSKVRMIQTSLRWADVPSKESNRNWIADGIHMQEFDKYNRDNILSMDVDTKEIITYDDFYDYEYYPNPDSDILTHVPSDEL